MSGSLSGEINRVRGPHVQQDAFYASRFVASDRKSPAVEPTSSSSLYPRILKGGAAVFILLSTGLIAWLINQWIEHPEVQASQLGNTAPFWPAVIVFVLVSMAAGVALLWRAASRLESGENLFEERHRKSLKDLEEDAES